MRQESLQNEENNMKKLALFTLTLLLLAPAVHAGRKKPRAGKIENNTYQDTKYNFELVIHENWKPRVNKADNDVRLVLTQKNYAIPADYLDAPDYTRVPRLAVYVDTTSLSVHAFVDSLTNERFESDQKKKITKEFDFLQEPEIIPKGRKRLTIGSETGLLWKGQSKYVKEVSTSASSVGGKRVYGSYGGAIAAVKHGNTVILFHLICEWPYFENILGEVQTVVNSLKWMEADA